jgi:hypothetical protein
MKCAIGFVLLIVFMTLAGCGGSDEVVTRATMESKTEYIKIYEIKNSDLRCADGIVYLRIGPKEYTAKINKETLLPERCN